MPALLRTALIALLTAASGSLLAGEFSVTPIRAELKAGTLSETITITNHSSARLRLSVKLMEWSQDDKGEDVYKDSSDLVYFPRQLDMDPDSKRLVRIGVKSPAGPIERTYRLFIEEQPEPATAGRAQIGFYFRFGVPVFLPPVLPRPVAEVNEPTLGAGKLAVQVRNSGNQHVRLSKLTVSDGSGYSQEIAGWYSLAGTQRTYTLDIPREVCVKAGKLSLAMEGEGLRFDRSLHVDPTRCS